MIGCKKLLTLNAIPSIQKIWSSHLRGNDTGYLEDPSLNSFVNRPGNIEFEMISSE